jgi:SagB-type dehydrogenase family enzyme
MKKIFKGLALSVFLMAGLALAADENVKLPAPDTNAGQPFNQVVNTRRSIREFKDAPLSLQEFSQLCWSAQGITDQKTGYRAAPSAVHTYPLKLYAVVKGNGVTGLPGGVYLYEPKDHSLKIIKQGDLFAELVKGMPVFNKWVEQTDVVFVFTGTSTYISKLIPESGEMYVHIEAGMASENLLLQTVSLGLGGTAVGGFSEKKVPALLGIEKNAETLLLVPVGKL